MARTLQVVVKAVALVPFTVLSRNRRPVEDVEIRPALDGFGEVAVVSNRTGGPQAVDGANADRSVSADHSEECVEHRVRSGGRSGAVPQVVRSDGDHVRTGVEAGPTRGPNSSGR